MRRTAAGLVRRRFAFSERRACALVGVGRATVRCQSRARPDDGPLRRRLLALAGERPRFGYRRLRALLRREGVAVNHKRVKRLYREDGVAVRRWGRKRVARASRGRPVPPGRPNEQWALDFLGNALASGNRVRVLAVIDAYTREALAIKVDTSLPTERVVRLLERVSAARGVPEQIVLDNGPELTGRALDQWADRRRVRPRFIDPGGADPERLLRELQRALPRRVPQRALVPRPRRRPPPHRGLASGQQAPPAPKFPRLPDDGRLRAGPRRS